MNQSRVGHSNKDVFWLVRMDVPPRGCELQQGCPDVQTLIADLGGGEWEYTGLVLIYLFTSSLVWLIFAWIYCFCFHSFELVCLHLFVCLLTFVYLFVCLNYCLFICLFVCICLFGWVWVHGFSAHLFVYILSCLLDFCFDALFVDICLFVCRLLQKCLPERVTSQK